MMECQVLLKIAQGLDRFIYYHSVTTIMDNLSAQTPKLSLVLGIPMESSASPQYFAFDNQFGACFELYRVSQKSGLSLLSRLLALDHEPGKGLVLTSEVSFDVYLDGDVRYALRPLSAADLSAIRDNARLIRGSDLEYTLSQRGKI
jgi:hypothetical protein